MFIIKTKKGMGIGQVFIFIVAAITFALIMVFGYRAVTDFLESGEKVEFVQFKNDLESSVKKIYTEFGSVRVENFHTPAKFTKICFVDLDDEIGDMEALCKEDQIACDVWQNARDEGGYNTLDENVFLTPPADVKIKVYRAEIDGGYVCQKITNGQFTVVLEGLGDRTKISSG